VKGVIKVYSEPGKGTEFNIYLPVVKSSSEKQNIHQTKEPIQGGTEQILLIDDEKAILTMEKKILERLMHENFLIYRHARATMMQKTQDYLIIVFLITGKINTG
jgi:hypothetical protein